MIYLQATVPELLGAFRIALAGAWGLETVAELLGAQQGAGFLIAFFVQTYALQSLIALTLALGILAVIVDFVVMLFAKALVRWTDPHPAN
jgi:ABC-type nitrate/sulfonate/bicarbonate transport system permease component